MNGPKGYSHDRILKNFPKHGAVNITRHRAGVIQNLYDLATEVSKKCEINSDCHIAEIGANQEQSIQLIFDKATIRRFDLHPKVDGIEEIDISKPPPKDLRGKFDIVTAIELIEHVFDVFKAVKNLSMLAKPKGGMIVLSTPFCYHLHTDKKNRVKDYWRFSQECLEELFSAHCQKVRVKAITDECCNAHLPWGYFTIAEK